MGHHPWIVVQGEPGNEQLVLFYFSHGAGRMNGGGGRRTYVHMAEITLGEDGKVVCDRDKYPAGR